MNLDCSNVQPTVRWLNTDSPLSFIQPSNRKKSTSRLNRPARLVLIFTPGCYCLASTLEPTQMGQWRSRMTSPGNELRRNRDADFFRSHRSNVDPDWSINPVKQMGCQSFRLQRFEDLNHFSSRANHSHVGRPGLYGPAQDPHVVTVPARHNHDVGSLIRVQLLGRFFEIERMHLPRLGKTFFRGVGRPVIRHDNVEPGQGGCFTSVERNMACTEKIKRRRRQDRLDKNFERSAANQPGLVLWILVQVKL